MTLDRRPGEGLGSAEQKPAKWTPPIITVECPRDAFQGLPKFIPTDEKIAYLRGLLDAGFTHIDFGSFVSPEAVPQMRDTEEVFAAVRGCRQGIRFIGIIANERGFDRALDAGVPAVGYPFSISDTFQKNNTGKSIDESRPVLEALYRRATASGVELDVYLSMGFGNPYSEPWSVALVTDALQRFRDIGITRVMLADTTGCACPAQIREVFAASRGRFPDLQLGAHFHASPPKWRANAEAALDAGCVRLDSALGGIGGCPFAKEELVGNIPTEGLLTLLRGRGIEVPVPEDRLRAALRTAREIHERYQ
jgi:hydroxymethylglutaryl-CoA lyase